MEKRMGTIIGAQTPKRDHQPSRMRRLKDDVRWREKVMEEGKRKKSYVGYESQAEL
jgi:hypothetical protein